MGVAFWSIILVALAVPVQNAAPRHDSPTRLLWQAAKRGCTLSQPIVHGSLVFIGACTGQFYALEKNSGKQEWAYDTRADGASGEFRATPILHSGSVLAGTEGACTPDGKGYLYAFDQHTGKVRWKLPAAVTSTNLVLVGDTIVFGTREGGMSVDLETGEKKWNFEVSAKPTTCDVRTSIATDGVNVYLFAADAVIYALAGASGRQLWRFSPPSTITTSLLIYKDVLYFGVPGEIESINIADGQPLGELKFSATPEGVLAWHRRGEDYFEYSYGTAKAAGKGALLAFSDEFERLLWSQMTSEPWTSGAPMPWKGLVVAGNCHGDISAYEGLSGALAWKRRVNGCVTGFEHDDSTLYITVKEGALYAFRPPTN